MNRYLISTMLVLLMAGMETVNAQTAARVEYRSGRINLSVGVRDLPVHVVQPRPMLGAGWVAAELGPVRLLVRQTHPYGFRETLHRNELRRLLGYDTVRRFERHARALGLRGQLEGRWYRIDRRTVKLVVTVRGAPVATLYDFGSNGIFERVYLASPPLRYR